MIGFEIIGLKNDREILKFSADDLENRPDLLLKLFALTWKLVAKSRI